jgi:two-component system, chemotaxis family, protein-glutamate methylesterase/glutaminase
VTRKPTHEPAREPTRIRVLIVDDSQVARDLLVYLFNADSRLQVIGTAEDGEQAVAMAQRLLPDVIAMDIHLPKMDGYEATRKIMETCPTRIVMVTATALPHEVAATFHALEAGALTVLAKPLGPAHPGYAQMADELLRTIRLMAEVQVVRRWARKASAIAGKMSHEPLPRAEIRLVAIGASTGGPLVLQTILKRLPRTFSVPILIVQHISGGFSPGLAEWLGRTSGFPVRIPRYGEPVQPGIAYFAPDDLHLQVTPDGRIALSSAPPEHGSRPAVSCLFRSVATAFGPNAVGVLLTGMGRDGARELKQMQDAGAVTIAQDKESAIVNGMPGEAVKLNAATYVLAPEDIASTLDWLVKQRKSRIGLDSGSDSAPDNGRSG